MSTTTSGPGAPLGEDERWLIDAHWRAANFLSVEHDSGLQRLAGSDDMRDVLLLAQDGETAHPIGA